MSRTILWAQRGTRARCTSLRYWQLGRKASFERSFSVLIALFWQATDDTMSEYANCERLSSIALALVSRAALCQRIQHFTDCPVGLALGLDRLFSYGQPVVAT